MSVVLPVYNQADHLSAIVEGYEATLERLPVGHETLLVVNGSDDGSWEVAQQLEATRPAVRAIAADRRGWGNAVQLGLREARGDILCYTNSARTSDRDLSLLLLYAVTYPRVVVKANRKIRDNWRRRLGSLLYNLECRTLFDLSNFDINGTPKVFPREFSRLLELSCSDDLIDLEFNVVCRRQEYPVIEVPILSTRRHGGRSTTNYGSAVRMYWGAYALRRRLNDTRSGP